MLYVLYVCSQFLLPFESRQTLLYATRFDRDRAMQRLVESAPVDASQLETSSERLVPRLERKRVSTCLW